MANAPVAVALKGVKAAVKDPAWQATSKGVAGLFLCPMVWGTEAFLVRRHGRRAVLGVAVAAPLGGLAWIAWREARVRWRQVRAEEVLLARRADAVRAAAATRAGVRATVDELIADAVSAAAATAPDTGAAAQSVSSPTT